MKQTDVIILGAGPAGSTLALRLAAGGLRVLLIDKKKFPREKVCGEFLNPRGVALLEELGLKEAVELHSPESVFGQKIHSENGSVMQGLYGEKNGLALPRPLFDSILLDSAKKKENIEVWEEASVTEIESASSKNIRIQGVDVSGKTFQAEASLLVGADGVQSFVAKQRGLQSKKNRAPKYALATRFSGVKHQNRGEMFLIPNGYIGLAPLGQNTVGVSAVIPQTLSHSLAGNPQQRFDEILNRAPKLQQRLQTGKQICPVLATGWRPRYFKKIIAHRTLLVGDAAFFVDPFTGEGMSLALLGSKLAAQAILKAAQKKKDLCTALSRYQLLFYKKFFLTILRCLWLQKFLYRPAVMNRAAAYLSRNRFLSDQLVRICGGLTVGRSTKKEVSLPGRL